MTKPLVTPTPESEAFESMFGDVISEYSDEQAIDDGVLHHLWPETWPWLLVTEMVYAEACGVADDRNVKWHQVLVPLVMDAIMATQRQAKLNPRCDIVELEHTAIGTVWVRPNSKGGMTVMKPEEN